MTSPKKTVPATTRDFVRHFKKCRDHWVRHFGTRVGFYEWFTRTFVQGVQPFVVAFE